MFTSPRRYTAPHEALKPHRSLTLMGTSQIDPGNGTGRAINFDLHASSGTGQLEIRRLRRGLRVELQRSLPGSPQNGLMHWYSGPRRGTGGGCSNEAIAQATVASNGASRISSMPFSRGVSGKSPEL